ncbi:MAG: hypothetical protein K0R57_3831 [Paenibacillaceae bacterium]|nr:hypothetical protein [Paenibacillaceae bacterium]
MKRLAEKQSGVRKMRRILDVADIVRELNISPEHFAQWKTVNLDHTIDCGSGAWSVPEEAALSPQELAPIP